MNKVNPVLLTIFVFVFFFCSNLLLYFVYNDRKDAADRRIAYIEGKKALMIKGENNVISTDPELDRKLEQVKMHFHDNPDSYLLKEGEFVKQKIEWYGISLVKYLVDEGRLSFSVKGQLSGLFGLLEEIESQDLFWNINGVSLRYQKEYYSLDFALESVVLPSDDELASINDPIFGVEKSDFSPDIGRLIALFRRTERKKTTVPEIVEIEDFTEEPKIIYSDAPEWLSFVGVSRESENEDERYLFMDSRTGKIKTLQNEINNDGWEFIGVDLEGYLLVIDGITYLLSTNENNSQK